VTATETIHDHLRRAFAPTRNGVVGLTEQLFRVWASVGGETEFERVGDQCACRWTVNGDTQESPLPIPPAAFRALLAQVAALCGAPPHGGQAALAGLHVGFVNTPEVQQLKLKSATVEAAEVVAPNTLGAETSCGALPVPAHTG
jgi:hypothetical protein